MITYTLPSLPLREDISILICHRNTLENISLCVSSLLTHYPDMRINVLDGMSTDYSRTWLKTREQLYTQLRVHDWTSGYNSHGAMMDDAIKNIITTPFVWLLDSDTIIRYRVEPRMDGYASGTLMMQSRVKEGCAPAGGGDCVRYVHPSCMILNRSSYLKYRPFTDHGAPCIWNMIDAEDAGEATYQWGEGMHYHLCGGSWTTPRTVWWGDMDCQSRPLLTIIDGGAQQPDCNSVYRFGEVPMDIVMWEHPPTVSRDGFAQRMSVNGEYVSVGDGDVYELSKMIQENGALDHFHPNYIRRDVWQRGFGG